MRAYDIAPADLPGVPARPIVIVRDLDAVEGARWRKGRVLTPEDVEALRLSGEPTIRVIELDPGDLHEDDASYRIARAVAGAAVAVRGPVESAVRLTAAERGVLTIDVPLLKRINTLPGLTIYTAFDGQVVEIDQPLAGVKVTPLAVPASVVAAAETLCRDASPPITVRTFRPLKVAVINREPIEAPKLARFEFQMRERMDWFHGELLGIHPAASLNADGLRDLLRARLHERAELVIITGTRSTDPLDEAVEAAKAIGARVLRQGMPSHPGSTYWLANIGNVPIVGLASCGTLSDSTTFDLLLPRFFAGLPVDADYLAGLGHGGMLGADMQFRFPPYLRRQSRGSSHGHD